MSHDLFRAKSIPFSELQYQSGTITLTHLQITAYPKHVTELVDSGYATIYIYGLFYGNFICCGLNTECQDLPHCIWYRNVTCHINTDILNLLPYVSLVYLLGLMGILFKVLNELHMNLGLLTNVNESWYNKLPLYDYYHIQFHLF
jgi:hypothetical protein